MLVVVVMVLQFFLVWLLLLWLCRYTDIVTYRAAIAAKNLRMSPSVKTDQLTCHNSVKEVIELKISRGYFKICSSLPYCFESVLFDDF